MMDDGDGRPQIPISDAKTVRAILIAAAKKRKSMSYAEVLDALGYRFSRPKMRALCKTLGAVDRLGKTGEPELAVLVVRQSDGLPGQGWWVETVRDHGYDGLWTGPDAIAFIKKHQKRVFDYWSKQKPASKPAPARTRTPSRTSR